MVNFKVIIERIKSVTGFSQKEIASQLFGISAENLSNKIRRNSVDISQLIDWAREKCIDLNWLLAGIGEPILQRDINHLKDKPTSDSDAILFQHMKLVGNFKDKQRALNISEEILEIEKLDPEAFIRIESYLKGILDSLRMVSQRKTIK